MNSGALLCGRDDSNAAASASGECVIKARKFEPICSSRLGFGLLVILAAAHLVISFLSLVIRALLYSLFPQKVGLAD